MLQHQNFHRRSDQNVLLQPGHMTWSPHILSSTSLRRRVFQTLHFNSSGTKQLIMHWTTSAYIGQADHALDKLTLFWTRSPYIGQDHHTLDEITIIQKRSHTQDKITIIQTSSPYFRQSYHRDKIIIFWTSSPYIGHDHQTLDMITILWKRSP